MWNSLLAVNFASVYLRKREEDTFRRYFPANDLDGCMEGFLGAS